MLIEHAGVIEMIASYVITGLSSYVFQDVLQGTVCETFVCRVKEKIK